MSEPVAPLEERVERRDQMLRDRDDGMTLRGIGRKYGVSRERARQILASEPKAVGLPRLVQLRSRQKRLLVKRQLWAKRTSPAGIARVAAIDAKLTALIEEAKEVEP